MIRRPPTEPDDKLSAYKVEYDTKRIAAGNTDTKSCTRLLFEPHVYDEGHSQVLGERTAYTYHDS